MSLCLSPRSRRGRRSRGRYVPLGCFASLAMTIPVRPQLQFAPGDQLGAGVNLGQGGVVGPEKSPCKYKSLPKTEFVL
jgi:hypothetical protein